MAPMMIHFLLELWWDDVDELEEVKPRPAAESLLTAWVIFSGWVVAVKEVAGTRFEGVGAGVGLAAAMAAGLGEADFQLSQQLTHWIHESDSGFITPRGIPELQTGLLPTTKLR